MRAGRPTSSEERWIAVAARYPVLRRIDLVVSGAGGWHAVSFLTRCGLFVLGLIAALASCGLCFIAFGEHALIPAGVGMWLAGELLMRQRRWFASGMEEALIASAFTALAVGALGVQRAWNNDLLIAWAVSAAWLVAGLRLLNPLFTTLAALLGSYALYDTLNRGLPGLSQGETAHVWAGWACFAAAALTLALGRRIWQRPGHDRMLDWLVVALPVAAYLHVAGRSWMGLAWEQGAGGSAIVVIALFGFAAVSIVLALRRRTHAPLISAVACGVCLAYELRHVTGMPLYARLIVWGSLALVVSHLLERYLRTPRAGITSGQLADQDAAFDMAEMASMAVTTPASRASVSAPSTEPAVQGQGGGFGGGGASGRY